MAHTVIQFKTKKNKFGDNCKVYGSGCLADYETLPDGTEKDWHAVSVTGDGENTICGQVYSDYDYKEKEVHKGNITCNGCLNVIESIKSIQL